MFPFNYQYKSEELKNASSVKPSKKRMSRCQNLLDCFRHNRKCNVEDTPHEPKPAFQTEMEAKEYGMTLLNRLDTENQSPVTQDKIQIIRSVFKCCSMFSISQETIILLNPCAKIRPKKQSFKVRMSHISDRRLPTIIEDKNGLDSPEPPVKVGPYTFRSPKYLRITEMNVNEMNASIDAEFLEDEVKSMDSVGMLMQVSGAEDIWEECIDLGCEYKLLDTLSVDERVGEWLNHDPVNNMVECTGYSVIGYPSPNCTDFPNCTEIYRTIDGLAHDHCPIS